MAVPALAASIHATLVFNGVPYSHAQYLLSLNPPAVYARFINLFSPKNTQSTSWIFNWKFCCTLFTRHISNFLHFPTVWSSVVLRTHLSYNDPYSQISWKLCHWSHIKHLLTSLSSTYLTPTLSIIHIIPFQTSSFKNGIEQLATSGEYKYIPPNVFCS